MRLAAEKIDLDYGGAEPVLRNFSLDLRGGELVGVVGPNGSGKSTLIRALSRTLRPRQGAVLLEDRDLFRDRTARQAAQSIGTVPQSTEVAFEFTAREVVQMGRSPHLPRHPFAGATARDAEIVDRAMAQAGVAHLADRIASTLSGGERQRVLLARALAQEPGVILLDEPTAHLDIHHQAQLLSLVRSLAHDDGVAVLAVLHDLNLAAEYCDRLALLHGGRVIALGAPAEVLTAEHVRAAYGARVWVRCHPTNGRPLILSLPHDPEISDEAAPEAPLGDVLVVCGGGTGAGLMLRLRQAGWGVRAAGLNIGDTDLEAAEMLGVPSVSEAPFTALSEEAARRIEASALTAQAVVVTDVPFGRANLANLRAALHAAQAGKTVICLQSPETSFAERDFTGGEAAALWDELLAAGAMAAPDGDSVLMGLLESLRAE
ncbi:MAG: heme ABC transporter ATP-binding protein [Capsulimonas sp.]|uniref:heme ABC transporter ATP-binding protein n=1 Tax=Capsulimonas sp. TaxID=2494211 RepID=UPI0032643FC0